MKELEEVGVEPLNVGGEETKKEKKSRWGTVPTVTNLVFFFLLVLSIILYVHKAAEYVRLEKKVMDNIFSPYHSDLIPDLSTLRTLKNWVKETFLKVEGRSVVPTLRMYYKSSVDGDDADDFHSRTDGWKGFIVIVEDTDGNIFGGFTSENFRGNMLVGVNYPVQKDDRLAFLFSLSLNEKYEGVLGKEKNNIYGDGEEGPIFGDFGYNDIRIMSGCLRTDRNECMFPSHFRMDGISEDQQKCRLTNGKKFFKVKEMEAFKVNIK